MYKPKHRVAHRGTSEESHNIEIINSDTNKPSLIIEMKDDVYSKLFLPHVKKMLTAHPDKTQLTFELMNAYGRAYKEHGIIGMRTC